MTEKYKIALRAAASMMLSTALCGACMAGMIALWPALSAAACHGVLIALATSMGFLTSLLSSYLTLEDEDTPEENRLSVSEAYIVILGAMLFAVLLLVPLLSVLHVGLAHAIAQIGGVALKSGYTVLNVASSVGAASIECGLVAGACMFSIQGSSQVATA